MAKKRLDPNVVKLIKLLMHACDREQITKTLDFIYKEVLTVPQKQELIYDWQSLFRNIKYARDTKQKERIEKRKQTEY